MTQYQSLADGARTDVYIPETDHPVVVPGYTDDDTAMMSQRINDTAIERWGDDNRIHTDPAMVQAFLDVTEMAAVPDGETIVPGAPGFAYEAVRRADQPVDTVSSDFDEVVHTADTVEEQRVDTADGEQVAYLLDDTGEETSTHALTYDDQAAYDPQETAAVNGAKAYAIPAALGLADQEGNVLLGLEADLDDVRGRNVVARDYMEVEKDGPFNIGTDTYTFEDAATGEDRGEVAFTLLRYDDEVMEQIAEQYEERQEEAYMHPMEPMVAFLGDVGRGHVNGTMNALQNPANPFAYSAGFAEAIEYEQDGVAD